MAFFGTPGIGEMQSASRELQSTSIEREFGGSHPTNDEVILRWMVFVQERGDDDVGLVVNGRWLDLDTKNGCARRDHVALSADRYRCEDVIPCDMKFSLFNNVFTLKKIWAACPYMLSVSLIRCTNEALKILHLKSTIKCFKEVKIYND